jgi:hypothetical protein
MRTITLLSMVLVGACVDMDDRGATIAGTSGDVVTQPGQYDGYRVVTPCDGRYVNIGVIGTGSVELTELSDVTAVADDLAGTLRDMPSVWNRTGYGLACESGVGAVFSTNDWHDVDLMIARIGEYLHERDYAVQVGISVDSIPVAQ